MTTEESEATRVFTISIIIGIIYFIIYLSIKEAPFWPFFVILLVFIVGLSQKDAYYKKIENQKLKREGIDPKEFFQIGKYISGHPDIDKDFEPCYMVQHESNFKLYRLNTDGSKSFVAIIPKSSINKVVIEDESTIQKRVGLKRMLLIGVFAFAAKKSVKMELAYLIIEWSQSRFENETVFEFKNAGALTRANTIRNKILNQINQNESTKF